LAGAVALLVTVVELQEQVVQVAVAQVRLVVTQLLEQVRMEQLVKVIGAVTV
jgi:hypothetical protein